MNIWLYSPFFYFYNNSGKAVFPTQVGTGHCPQHFGPFESDSLFFKKPGSGRSTNTEIISFFQNIGSIWFVVPSTHCRKRSSRQKEGQARSNWGHRRARGSCVSHIKDTCVRSFHILWKWKIFNFIISIFISFFVV